MTLDELFTTQARTLTPPLYGPSAAAGPVPLISLGYGLADPALLPREELLDAAARTLAADANGALNYGPNAAALVELVVERLRREGVAARPEQTMLAYGSSQILGLLPYVLLEPGDTVIVEAPTFSGAVTRFRMAGAQIVGVPVDAHGLDVDALETLLVELRARGVRPKFIYCIPTFQNPTGATLSLQRRERLVQLAAAHGVLVVEDDAYVDLRFRGAPLPPLAALDGEGWVVRVGTFSKILAPGLRMGWAHGAQALIDRLLMFKVEGGSGPFLTRLVAQFAADGRLDEHILALRELYAAKCATMAAALRRELPDAQFAEPDGGFFIWLCLPDGVLASALHPVALQHGVELLAGPRCFADGSGDAFIRLAFSVEPAPRIEEAVRRLGAAVRELQARHE
jgi:DNA-binding transcriptional MocR family regulator